MTSIFCDDDCRRCEYKAIEERDNLTICRCLKSLDNGWGVDANVQVLMPVYNEENNLKLCLRSLYQQTLKPKKVIVINDGSSDTSLEIIKKFSNPSVLIDTLPRKQFDKTPVGVSLHYSWVVSEGSKYLDSDFDYVAILDADTVLEQRYYEKLVSYLIKNPKLGIIGGALIGHPDPGLILGLLPFVFGCNRIFTRKCWLDVNNGAIAKVICKPDTYQHLRARTLGYKPTRFDEVKSYCLRPATMFPFSTGYFSYMLGYYNWYLLLRALRNRSPRMIAGYLKAWALGEEQFEVKSLVRKSEVDRIKTLIGIKTQSKEDTETAKKVEELLYKRRW